MSPGRRSVVRHVRESSRFRRKKLSKWQRCMKSRSLLEGQSYAVSDRREVRKLADRSPKIDQRRHRSVGLHEHDHVCENPRVLVTMFIRNAAESPQSMGRSFNPWPIRFRKCIQPIAANVKKYFRSVSLHGTIPRSESRIITLAINSRLPAYNDSSRHVAACSQSPVSFLSSDCCHVPFWEPSGLRQRLSGQSLRSCCMSWCSAR